MACLSDALGGRGMPCLPILMKCESKCHEKLLARRLSQILRISLLCLSAWNNGEMEENDCFQNNPTTKRSLRG